ncbi:hypothetical protein GCM10009808_16590 [Microbacterium sediminicola]|uniref:Acyltransferase n=1 Tax=Microbacterium sediminicola TaxID=415210 RepID=A0ABN2I6T8_9MICO
MTTQPTTIPFRRDIQGLRALAVLAVIGAHALGWPAGGFVGVDVFFVISGFLITRMLLEEAAVRGRVSLPRFYARRARRILPAALVTLAVVTAVSFVVFNTARAHQTLWDAISAALLVSNWRFAAEQTDYFQSSSPVSPLQNFWSLSVEEQFYLVWPALLVLVWLALAGRAARSARGRWAVGVTSLALAIASFSWAMGETADHPLSAYFSTFTRVWELAFGATLAAAAPALARLPRGIGMALSWVGLVGVCASFVVIDPAIEGFPAPWAALPVAAAGLILIGGSSGGPRQRHLFPLSNPVTVFIGDASYSLYLWHFPVIVIAAAAVPASQAASWIVLAAIAIIGLASFFIVEQPLRHAPFLGGNLPRAQSAPADPTEHMPRVGAPTVAAPTVGSTRPAGWVPGTRYYPGSPRPTASPMARPVGTPSHVIEPAPRVPVSNLEPTDLTSASARASTSYADWRARFGAQVFLAGAGLVTATLAVLLVLQPSFTTAVIGVGANVEEPVTADDAAAELQADVAAAVMASAWPALSPSLDDVMMRGSAANPARDCFSPSVTPDLGSCTWGNDAAPTHIYLVGDSTAMAYAPAFRALAEDSGGAIRATTIGLYGCRFTDVLVDNDDDAVMAACESRKALVRDAIVRDQPTVVVTSNIFTLGHTTAGQDLSATDLIAAQAAEEASYGVPTITLAPPPSGANLSACYRPGSSPFDCAVAIDPTWREMSDAAAAIGTYIDSLPFSCWEDVCPAFAGTIPTKYDQTHLTVAYSERIAPYLLAQMRATGLVP